MKTRRSGTNVNVTLNPERVKQWLAGKQFPCPTCGLGLPIRISRVNKPYLVCTGCANQFFVRGKVGIERLTKLVESNQLFWARKSAEWHSEEQQINIAIQALAQVQPEQLVDAVRILELANKAHFLYLKQTPIERAKLLKMVVSNCTIDAVNAYPTYRKPFDMTFARAKNEEWRALGDDLRTFCASWAGPKIDVLIHTPGARVKALGTVSCEGRCNTSAQTVANDPRK